LDNEWKFDPVIPLDSYKNFYKYHNIINNDYNRLIFSNCVPEESVIREK